MYKYLFTCYGLFYEILHVDTGQVGMDTDEFKTATFQRVYQYLRRRDQNKKLDLFKFQGNVEGTMTDCLQLFLRLFTKIF